MIQPERAPVKPRVICPASGESLPLEDEVRALLEAGARGVVEITGEAGSGKTTALRHLAAVLPSSARVKFVNGSLVPSAELGIHLVICAGDVPRAHYRVASYSLAGWHEDEWLEYLMAVHPRACASVLARLQIAPDRAAYPPLPGLWRIVLDEMATDDEVCCVRQALHRYFHHEMPPHLERPIRDWCLEAQLHPSKPTNDLERLGCHAGLVTTLRQPTFQVLLAAVKLAEDLAGGGPCDYLGGRLPRLLVREAGAAVAPRAAALDRLHQLMLNHHPRLQPMAASILHATATRWVCDGSKRPVLAGAYLDGVTWPGINLQDVNVSGADLSNADLQGANLSNVFATATNFRQALLRDTALELLRAERACFAGAELSGAQADRANFEQADLEGANLGGACLSRARFGRANLAGAQFTLADLSYAVLNDARILDADFSQANLEGAHLQRVRLATACFDGARFTRADLTEANLEGMVLPGADFSGADLTKADLTGSSMPHALFDNAKLCGAGLAEIDWEGVSLRGADLRGASFHLGTSRSGLLFTPIASEGSRTGFYTDDFDEQLFKSPEEIRKANLRGADLRGALIDHTDFYLVDLRDALFDPEQEEHFRRCGAILEARV
jgi:uncharacterized protein YjbI with pentapeptide repeats